MYNKWKILAMLVVGFLLINPLMAITEINAEFSYTKTVYGKSRENSVRNRKYGIVVAQYIFNLTGLELNYNQLSEVTTENSLLDIGDGKYLSSVQNKTLTTSYGVGLRQALAPYGSFLVPSIAIGYAKQIKNAVTSYTVNDGYTKAKIDFYHGESKHNAIFGTFTLRISLSRFMSISGSIQTVFKAYEYNDAKNNITYTSGLSWIL